MSQSRQVTRRDKSISRIAIIMLAVLSSVGLFLVAFDQGHVFSLVYGQDAFVDAFLHELSHDFRHMAGFPCH